METIISRLDKGFSEGEDYEGDLEEEDSEADEVGSLGDVNVTK